MSNKNEETITIKKSEYYELIAQSEMLEALKMVGVEGWEGYVLAEEALHMNSDI